LFLSTISLWVPEMHASTCSRKAASNADKEGRETGLDGSEFWTKMKRKKRRQRRQRRESEGKGITKDVEAKAVCWSKR
jgi:hypothetical protein